MKQLIPLNAAPARAASGRPVSAALLLFGLALGAGCADSGDAGATTSTGATTTGPSSCPRGAHIGPTNHLPSLFADATGLYYGVDKGMTGEIHRVTPANVETVIVAGKPDIEPIALNGTDVFFNADPSGAYASIARVAHDGGVQVYNPNGVFLHDTMPYTAEQIVADDKNVYFHDHTGGKLCAGIYAFPVDGTAGPTMVTSGCGGPDWVDAGVLYWAWPGDALTDAGVFSSVVATSTTKTLYAPPPHQGLTLGLGHDGGSLFFIEGSAIRSVSAAGGPVTTVLPASVLFGDGGAPIQVAASGGNVYFSYTVGTGDVAWEIDRVPASGGTPTTVLCGPSSPPRFVIGGDQLYEGGSANMVVIALP